MRLKEWLTLILNGGPGSGNWGHVGDPPRRGGSSPTLNVTKLPGSDEERNPRVSFLNGRDIERRKRNKKDRKEQYFSGNLRTSSIDTIYNGSSQEIKDLADKTGVIAIDNNTFDYIKNKLQPEQEKAQSKNETVPVKSDSWSLNGYYTKSKIRDSIEERIQWNLANDSLSSKVLTGNLDTVNATPYERRKIIDEIGNLMKYKSGVSYTSEDLVFVNKVKSYQKKDGNLSVNGVKYLTKLAEKGEIPESFLVALARRDLNDSLSLTYQNFINDMVAIKSDGDGVHSLKYTMPLSNLDDYYTIRDLQTRMMSSSFDFSGITSSDQLLKRIQDHVIETIEKNGFIIPDKLDRKKINVDDMIALSSVSPTERTQVTDNIRNTHDNITHGQFTTEVNNVFYVKNSGKTEKSYQDAIQIYGISTEQSNQIHATSRVSGPLIISNGYNASKTGMMGKGVYVTTVSSKSSAYLKGGASNFSHSGSQSGVMLINKVLMGKQINYSDWSTFKDSSIDSIYGGKGMSPKSGGYSLLNDEWVIRDTRAVLPVYYVDVTRKNK